MNKFLILLVLPVVFLGGCGLTNKNTTALTSADQNVITEIEKIIPELPVLCLDWQKFSVPKEWKKFQTDAFSISYPPGFTIIPYSSNQEINHTTFVSPDKKVQFSLSAPRWAESSDPADGSEIKSLIWNKKIEKILTCETELGLNVTQSTNLYLEKLDDSFRLAINILLSDGTARTERIFALSFPDKNTFLNYQSDFLKFLYTLEQYAD